MLFSTRSGSFLLHYSSKFWCNLSDMDKGCYSIVGSLLGRIVIFLRKFLFRVISVGPIPNHISFIMDGNRRFAKKCMVEEGAGHRAGFLSLMSMIKYCNEVGVKYISVYAFSIDNFRRRPEEVKYVMDLMLEKLEGILTQETALNKYGVKVYFIGNLKLLSEPIRAAAEKAMLVTAKNTEIVLFVCVAYTSTDEITHSAQESCQEKWDDNISEQNEDENPSIKLIDLEKHMYMRPAPDPDILIRTSGETRLSNFLLWQTTNSLLYSPRALWPEIGLPHLIWAVLNFQKNYTYLEKKRKQI